MSTNKPTRRTARTNRPDPAADDVARRFGARLRETRGSKTLRELSMESGVSIAYISDLERANLKNPSLVTLSKIARALDVSVDYLLGDPHTEPRGPAGSMPGSLARFVDGDLFQTAVADMSSAWKVDGATLAEEWKQLLSAVEVAGRRPQSESDWMFVFETIRRAVDQ